MLEYEKVIMKKKIFNEIIIVISAALWGVISLFSKPLKLMGFSALQIVAMRSFMAAVMIGLFMLIVDRSLFKIKLKDLPLFICSGIIGFAFCVYCYTDSIVENGAGVAAMLMYSSPIWVVLISRFLFKEKINIFKIIALLGVLGGCVMVSLGGELRITLIGALLGIGSGVGFAMVSIFSKLSSNKGYSSLTTQFYVFIFAGLVSFIGGKGWEIPDMIATDYNSLLYFFLLSLISTALPYVLYGFALKKVPASTAGILSSLEVVVGALAGFIAYQENIGILGVFGILIMLASLVLMELMGDKTPRLLKKNEKDQN